MTQELRICTRCVTNSTVPGVLFNNTGECNYCSIHDALDAAYPNDSRGIEKLDALFAKIAADGKGKAYDCVVGVSGGVDSTYLLHIAKSRGLRPLAVHFDNGWDSEIAVSNIKNSISALGIDLQTYVVDWEEFKDILRSHLKASLPWADAPTDLGLTSALYRIAAEEKVKYILVGNNFRSEGKQPTEWTYCDGKMIRAIQARFGTVKLKTFPNFSLWDVFKNSFLRRISLVRPIYFMEYSKQDAKRLVEKNYGWRDYGGHHYESIFTRFVYSIYLPEKFGIDKRIVSLSAQVRSAVISRDEALGVLASAAVSKDQRDSDMAYVTKKLGFSEAEFGEIMSAPRKAFTDYPSYYPMIRRFATIARRVTKLVLPWTPMMFYEMDAREA